MPRLAALALLLLPLAACSAREGDPAVWRLAPGAEVTAESTSVDVEVTRVDCASGRTGELLAPVVAYEESRVVTRIDAEPLVGPFDCPGNDRVPVTVELEEPVGRRTLVDGGCLREDAPPVSDCDDPVRWTGP